MRKTMILMLCLCLVFMLAACGSSSQSGDSGKKSGAGSGELNVNDLNIEDFEWNVEEARISGEDYYAFSLTNNSDYDILATEIKYKTAAGTDEDDLSVFKGFMKEHKDWIDEDQTIEDVTLRGQTDKFVAKGESVSDIPLTIGIDDYTWSDSPDEDQFDLMEPDELSLGIIKNDKLFIAYYDLSKEDWKIDSEVVELNKWEEENLADVVPKPDAKVFVNSPYDDSKNSIQGTAYGMSKDDFDSYVKLIEEAGFKDSDYEGGEYYDGKDDKGNSVSLEYDKYSESTYISADPKKDE